MSNDSGSEEGSNHRGAAYAWRPVAMLLMVMVGLIYLVQSDLARSAIQSLIASPLR
jgi:hypothetical protein